MLYLLVALPLLLPFVFQPPPLLYLLPLLHLVTGMGMQLLQNLLPSHCLSLPVCCFSIAKSYHSHRLPFPS